MSAASDHDTAGKAPKQRRPTEAEVSQCLSALIGPDRAIEIRAPKSSQNGGRLKNIVLRFGKGAFAAAATAAKRLSGTCPSVYVVMNGVDPNRAAGTKGAAAADIPSRRWLLVDCDPVRPADINATDGERFKAYEQAKHISATLATLDWPSPIFADSGNGFHLLYRIDLPNDGCSTALVKAVLASLAKLFDEVGTKVDQKVFDPPRLVKCYGTEVKKGDSGNSWDRPIRWSQILEVPDELAPVPVELLEAIALESASPEPAPAVIPIRSAPAAPARNGRLDPVERAERYIEKSPGAISGQGGHDAAFKMAVAVGPGFDLAPDVALNLLTRFYNPRCEPPWSDRELRHKIDEAYRVETRRGWLLDSNKNGNHVPPPNGPAGPRGVASSEEPTRERPQVVITTEEHEVVDQAVEALAQDPSIFQRGFMLVTIQRDKVPSQGIVRPQGTPQISPLPLARLRERLTKFAAFRKWRKGDEGMELIAAHPPDWTTNAVAARGEWPSIRTLESIVECPVIRYDGSILSTAGFDKLTGLLYEPSATFPPIKSKPTLADARSAAAMLLDLVTDFPFANKAHEASWLAGLLTPLARFAVAGPCPLFLFDAPAAGSGKSMLCDIISIVRTGREMSRKDYPEDGDELRKTITAVALGGDPLILLDNVATTFGGSALDGALTARTWKDRILGFSKMTPDLPLFTCWYATGNNVALKGDIMRRIVPCRVEPDVERPEERTSFKYPKLMQYVHENRPALAAAGLTILRAYFVAGKPDQKLTPLGSFEAWSDLVRSAVVWATGVDPCQARDDLRAADDTAENTASVVAGWAELPNGEGSGHTAAQALKLLKDHPERFDLLREAVMSWSRNGDLPNQKTVGKRLKAIRGRVFGVSHITSTPYQGTQVWFVRTASSRGSGGSGGSVSPLRGEKSQSITGKSPGNGREQSHQSHHSHQNGNGVHSNGQRWGPATEDDTPAIEIPGGDETP